MQEEGQASPHFPTPGTKEQTDNQFVREREVEPSHEESNSSPNMHTYICPYAEASNGSPTNDTDYQETQI